jgi:membrane protein implicated in regulation of membrane protease activity
MVILGMLLLGIGIIAILAAVFVSSGTAELLGMDLPAVSIFLVGVGAGAAVIWGFTIFKLGTKRELRQRREHKELSKLSQKLDKVESERHADDEAQ